MRNAAIAIATGALLLFLGFLPFAMVALWERKQRAINLWLMLVMRIWLFDIALSAVIGSHRFDFGFYGGRVFGLIAASFVPCSAARPTTASGRPC